MSCPTHQGRSNLYFFFFARRTSWVGLAGCRHDRRSCSSGDGVEMVSSREFPFVYLPSWRKPVGWACLVVVVTQWLEWQDHPEDGTVATSVVIISGGDCDCGLFPLHHGPSCLNAALVVVR
ncbi:hypothetical protein L3X38_033065 [Prunus dulcis]|uniref:Uncharacterized protein n=1 Tax=Prunus dulcis TaxID=3755 RepID=A0AAD4YVJ2_PRUDU|nr:hypothetical protein L3X38_033065 [Prunus dulcis]